MTPKKKENMECFTSPSLIVQVLCNSPQKILNGFLTYPYNTGITSKTK